MVSTRSARRLAALIALIAAFSIVLQFTINVLALGSLGASVAQMTRYFTILTNLLVMAMMGGIALGWRPPRMVILALVTAIVGVGLIYHVALAHLLDLRGWAIVGDQGVHTLVPALSALWWLLFGGPRKGDWRRLYLVLLWPLIYSAYALLRAAVTGLYPYPFMDLNQISTAMLSRNFVIVLLVFWLIAALLHGAVQWRRGR